MKKAFQLRTGALLVQRRVRMRSVLHRGFSYNFDETGVGAISMSLRDKVVATMNVPHPQRVVNDKFTLHCTVGVCASATGWSLFASVSSQPCVQGVLCARRFSFLARKLGTISSRIRCPVRSGSIRALVLLLLLLASPLDCCTQRLRA